MRVVRGRFEKVNVEFVEYLEVLQFLGKFEFYEMRPGTGDRVFAVESSIKLLDITVFGKVTSVKPDEITSLIYGCWYSFFISEVFLAFLSSE